MEQFLGNTGYALLIGFIVVLAYIALYFRDKYFKVLDEYLDLAGKKDFFKKRPSIMYADERKFFDILISLYGNNYYIFPQVRIASIIEVKNDVKDHDNLYRTIDHLSVDYVLYEKSTISPVLAIELNGKSHFQINRRNRDHVVENILTKAGIKFKPFQSTETYDKEEIKRNIDGILSV